MLDRWHRPHLERRPYHAPKTHPRGIYNARVAVDLAPGSDALLRALHRLVLWALPGPILPHVQRAVLSWVSGLLPSADADGYAARLRVCAAGLDPGLCAAGDEYGVRAVLLHTD